MGRSRAAVDLRNLWRNKQSLGFTVLLPVVLMVLFASVFDGEVRDTRVVQSHVYVASIVGSSLMSVGFVQLVVSIATEREAGMLQRLACTPLTASAYLIGKTISVLVTSAVQLVALLGVGVALYDVRLPSTAGRWGMFVAVWVLGVASATALGLAVSAFVRDARAAPAVVNIPFVALQFISGVFLLTTLLSPAMNRFAQLFPLHWIARGMRSALLPERYGLVETGGSWSRPTTLAVLAVWTVVGVVSARATFRLVRVR